MDLSGKTAIVTGGARGLGKAFSAAMLNRGANVVIADVELSAALDTVNEFLHEYGPGRAMFVQCDVTQEQQINHLFQKTKEIYGHIDVVVNNAGIGGEDRWKKMIPVNLVGVIYGTYQALEYMNKDSGGRGGLVVNVGSTAGLTVVAFEPVYSATKAGVVMFSRSVAARSHETTDQDIRVVCLCPSFTQTDMTGSARDEIFTNSVGNVGMMRIDRVVESFLKLVDDGYNNGGVLAVSPKSMFYRFPKGLGSKL